MFELVSSDTNIWIDFSIISRLDLPFRLDYTYIMFKEAIEAELIYPEGIKEKLVELGLCGVELTTEEFQYADIISDKYRQLSSNDAFALSIAKNRKIMLLTGDKALRNAAGLEGVSVIGTLGLLRKLYDDCKINNDEYRYCLTSLQANIGKGIRLPRNEIENELSKIK